MDSVKVGQNGWHMKPQAFGMMLLHKTLDAFGSFNTSTRFRDAALSRGTSQKPAGAAAILGIQIPEHATSRFRVFVLDSWEA